VVAGSAEVAQGGEVSETHTFSEDWDPEYTNDTPEARLFNWFEGLLDKMDPRRADEIVERLQGMSFQVAK
jgi:hypothetical protein